ELGVLGTSYQQATLGPGKVCPCAAWRSEFGRVKPNVLSRNPCGPHGFDVQALHRPGRLPTLFCPSEGVVPGDLAAGGEHGLQPQKMTRRPWTEIWTRSPSVRTALCGSNCHRCRAAL